MLGLARQAGLTNISVHRADDGAGKGWALYAIDLAQRPAQLSELAD